MKQIIFASILVLVFGVSAFAQNEKLPCPTMEVIGDGVVMPGEPMFFTVKLSDEAKNLNLEYEWSVSAGTLAKGQGSRSIAIDTTNLADVNITATVKIKGLPENCANTASETGSVFKIDIIDPDEYGKIPLQDERARLDAFMIAIQLNPQDQGFILINTEEKETRKQAMKRIQRILKHVKYRRFSVERITFAIKKSGFYSTMLLRIPKGGKIPCDDCEIINSKDFQLK